MSERTDKPRRDWVKSAVWLAFFGLAIGFWVFVLSCALSGSAEADGLDEPIFRSPPEPAERCLRCTANPRLVYCNAAQQIAVCGIQEDGGERPTRQTTIYDRTAQPPAATTPSEPIKRPKARPDKAPSVDRKKPHRPKARPKNKGSKRK